MSRRTTLVEEEFDDDTDLPLPSNSIPNLGTRGALLEAVSDDEDDDEDALFEQLEREEEDNEILGAFREQRLEALKAELTRTKDMRESDHGRLTEIMDEKEVIRTSA